MTAEEIAELIAHEESAHIEKKGHYHPKSGDDHDRLFKAVTAFANDLDDSGQRGYFLIGLDDKTNSRTGFQADDAFQQTIINKIRQAGDILPPLHVNFYKDAMPEGDVFVIEVLPSIETPVTYKREIWIRSGPTTSIANKAEERRLIEKNINRYQPFEMYPCRDATLADLDTTLFQTAYLPLAVSEATLLANDRTLEEKLAAQKFWHLKYACPTYLGLMAFGKKPTFHLPGAYVQYVHFDGDSMASDIILDRRFEGDIYDLVKQVGYILEHGVHSKPHETIGFQIIRRPNYPYDALRELAINAVMHRDYQSAAPVRIYAFSDRILFDNPGPAFGRARDDFRKENDYRNPGLASLLKTFGLVEQFGIGIKRVEQLAAANNNVVEFMPTACNSFNVVIYARPLE